VSLKRSSGTVPGLGSGDPDTWLSALFRRPSGETPHVDDQEFVGTIGGTAVTPSGTATWTQGRGVLSCSYQDMTAAHVAVRVWPMTPTAAPVTIETALRNVQPNDMGYGGAGICFSEGNTATDDTIICYWNSGDVSTDSTFGSKRGIAMTSVSTALAAANTSQAASTPLGMIYLRLIWTGTNAWKINMSIDGVTWTDWGTGALAGTIAPAYFGVFVWTEDTSTLEGLASFEYLRVTESDLSV